MIANLKHMQPAQLIGYVQSIDWTAIDYNTKLVVVHECNNAITALRVKHDLEPISDNLPNEPDTPFRTIKASRRTASSFAGSALGTITSPVPQGIAP